MNPTPEDPRIEHDWLVVTEQLRIPISEFRFSYSRSSGPGGQRVNKVSTKAHLRWTVLTSPSLSDEIRGRFVAKQRRRISVDGDFLISSQRYRDQSRNLADCLDKLRVLLAEAAVRPVPRKRTKPTAASRRRRLQEKRKRGETKQRRRPPGMDE